MGSAGLIGEDEFQPGIGKNDKLSRKFLDDSGGVDYSLVPRKQRSAIKKRARESITPPFPITLQQNHESYEVAEHKSRAKKSKRNKKKGRLTKEEKEVAETLHALADMFSDATKTDKPGTDLEPPETKPSTTATGDAVKPVLKEKIITRNSIEAVTLSPKLVDSTSQIFKFQSSHDTVKTDLAFGKQSDTPEIQVDKRQKMPFLDMNRSDEQAPSPIQVATPFAQYEKRSYHLRVERSFGSYQSLSLLPPRDPSSKMQVAQGSAPLLPAWLENAVSNSKPQVHGITISADKYPEVGIKTKAHRKRSLAHVHICRLINNLQVSGGNEGLQEKPSQQNTFNGARCVPIKMINKQENGFVYSSGITTTGPEKSTPQIQNALLLHHRLHQDQQLPFNTSSVSCSSTKQGTDFLPLGSRDGQMKGREGINGSGNNHEALKKLQANYLQSQNNFTMPFSLPGNSYSSNSAGQSSGAASQLVQVAPFIVSSLDKRVTEPLAQQFWPQQQKWPFHLQAQYNHGGVAAPVLADWKHGGRDSSSQLNYSQARFPHVHSAIYQQRPSQPQQQFMAVNSSMNLSDVNRLNNPLELQKRWFFASTNL